MTLLEIKRASEAYIKSHEYEAKEKAMFDYTQAMIIVQGVGKLLTGKGEIPTLYDSYSFFDDEKKKQDKELSIARFYEFADNFNKNYKRTEECQKSITE